METVPVTEADFTSVLPRFLSLYVLSFLSPRDLCSAAQVSWHWRVLAEQVRGEVFAVSCSLRLLHSDILRSLHLPPPRTVSGLAAASQEAGSFHTLQ